MITITAQPIPTAPRRLEALPGRAVQKVEAVERTAPYQGQGGQAEVARRVAADSLANRIADSARDRDSRRADPRQQESAESGRAAQPAALPAGALHAAASGLGPQGRDSGGFLAQALTEGGESGPGTDLHLRPDGAERGSLAYRKAGGEPQLFNEEPAFFRIRA